MSQEFFGKTYRVIGTWTRVLLHPDLPPPSPYRLLKRALADCGASRQTEQGGDARPPQETFKTPPSERTLSFWTIGDVSMILREDGIFLLTELSQEAAELLHQTTKSLADSPEVTTFQLAPAPPEPEPQELLQRTATQILAPLDQGPFANARFWTIVDHIHDGANTRERYYGKIGIDISGEDKEEKTASSAS